MQKNNDDFSLNEFFGENDFHNITEYGQTIISRFSQEEQNYINNNILRHPEIIQNNDKLDILYMILENISLLSEPHNVVKKMNALKKLLEVNTIPQAASKIPGVSWAFSTISYITNSPSITDTRIRVLRIVFIDPDLLRLILLIANFFGIYFEHLHATIKDLIQKDMYNWSNANDLGWGITSKYNQGYYFAMLNNLEKLIKQGRIKKDESIKCNVGNAYDFYIKTQSIYENVRSMEIRIGNAIEIQQKMNNNTEAQNQKGFDLNPNDFFIE